MTEKDTWKTYFISLFKIYNAYNLYYILNRVIIHSMLVNQRDTY